VVREDDDIWRGSATIASKHAAMNDERGTRFARRRDAASGGEHAWPLALRAFKRAHELDVLRPRCSGPDGEHGGDASEAGEKATSIHV
jgi:hypothetical protein